MSKRCLRDPLSCRLQLKDGARRGRQKISDARAMRAADELRQHDVASAVLQAGPNAAERLSELGHREGAFLKHVYVVHFLLCR